MAKLTDYIQYLESQLTDLDTNRRMDAILERLYKAHIINNLSELSAAKSQTVNTQGTTEIIPDPDPNEFIALESVIITPTKSQPVGALISEISLVSDGVSFLDLTRNPNDVDSLVLLFSSPIKLLPGNGVSILLGSLISVTVSVVYKVIEE